jgi:hypothetical protein
MTSQLLEDVGGPIGLPEFESIANPNLGRHEHEASFICDEVLTRNPISPGYWSELIREPDPFGDQTHVIPP